MTRQLLMYGQSGQVVNAMFDKLKAVAGVASLLKDLPGVKARLLQVKEELGRVQCTGHSQCRRVRAVMNGRLEMASVEIDDSLLSQAGTERGQKDLREAIVQATNDASAHARREAATRLSSVAQEMGIPVPQGLLDLI